MSKSEQHETKSLFERLYRRLQRIAENRMVGESPSVSVSATDLLHETYLRLTKDVDRNWENSSHFLATATNTMRFVLVDRARSRKRIKRGGGVPTQSIDGKELPFESKADEVLIVDEVLDLLTQQHADAAQIVKLRYFAGFTTHEAAMVIGISKAAAYRHWRFAKAWILAEPRLENFESPATDRNEKD